MSSSAPTAIADNVPLHLEIEGDDPGLAVAEASARFAMSQVFEFRILATHADANLKTGPLLGKKAKVTIAEDPLRPVVEGIIRSVRAVEASHVGKPRYEILVVPGAWLLTRRKNDRIYRDLNVEGLAREVAKILGDKAPILGELAQTYAPHEYSVQYAETDHDALFRLLAEDGVASFFDPAKGTALILTDDTNASSQSRSVTLPFIPPSSQRPDSVPHVHEIVPWNQVVTSSARVREYWFERPDFVPESTASAADATDLADLEFRIGAGADEATVAQQANAKLAEHQAPGAMVVLKSNAFVPPGYRVHIEGSPRDEGDEDLLVVRSVSTWAAGATGAAPAARHELFCMPASRRFAPPRLPKPRIGGVQTAVVVGDGEIDVDEHGRVACKFHWDTASVSRRVRVSQGWAGPGYGLVTHPRVGDEVVIAYLDADADEPLIVGRVHNGTNVSPLTLPKDKTVSVWRTKSSPGGDGYNEILMDDAAGQERFEVHAQRDYKEVVERDEDVHIKRNHNLKVDGNHNLLVRGTGDLHYQSPFQITGPKGEISTDWELLLKSNLVRINANFRVDESTGNYTHHAGAVFYSMDSVFKIEGPKCEINCGEGIYLICGGSRIEVLPGEINIKSSGPVNINGAPINLNC